jgi:hypothetical protein
VYGGLPWLCGSLGIGIRAGRSELLRDGSRKTVDISAFRPERLREGKPIKTEFEYQNE